MLTVTIGAEWLAKVWKDVWLMRNMWWWMVEFDGFRNNKEGTC